MTNTIAIVIGLLGIPFLIYSVYYCVIGIFGLRKPNTFKEADEKKRLCAVIAARNEGMVIGNLIDSLFNQNYPKDKLEVYVLPNNCTDNTAEVALEHGAKVFKCSSKVHSKGAALQEFFKDTFAHNDIYDAFCIFDADNLVDPEFFNAMNNALCSGEGLAQGYRDSKNPKDTWISGSQSIFYWMIDRFLNLARYALGMSAVINGTGWMVSADVLKQTGGFNTFSLTEDIEFTTQNIMAGRKVAWVPQAKIYDEHPLDFKSSWKQRKRWSTGTLQCLTHYRPMLWKAFKETKNIGCLDMMLYLSAPVVQILSVIYILFCLVVYGMVMVSTGYVLSGFTVMVVGNVLGIFTCLAGTMISVKLEHHKLKQVKTSSFFGFFFWFISWAVINIACLVNPLTTWEPIAHTRSVKLSQLEATE